MKAQEKYLTPQLLFPLIDRSHEKEMLGNMKELCIYVESYILTFIFKNYQQQMLQNTKRGRILKLCFPLSPSPRHSVPLPEASVMTVFLCPSHIFCAFSNIYVYIFPRSTCCFQPCLIHLTVSPGSHSISGHIHLPHSFE